MYSSSSGDVVQDENKTIIGLKSWCMWINDRTKHDENKTIIGLKFVYWPLKCWGNATMKIRL